MKITNETFKRKSLLLVLIAIILIISVTQIEVGVWGMNKTVGWAWDISNLFWSTLGFAFIIIPAFYLILFFFKIKINKSLSIVQLSLLLLTLLSFTGMDSRLTFLLTILSLVVFITNLIWIIVKRLPYRRTS